MTLLARCAISQYALTSSCEEGHIPLFKGGNSSAAMRFVIDINAAPILKLLLYRRQYVALRSDLVMTHHNADPGTV